MQHPGECQRGSGECAVGVDDPAHQRQRADRHDDHVEPAERHRQAAGIFAHQPVAGKARDDAAADQRDQQHDDGDADPDPGLRGAVEMRLEVKRDIAGEQQQNQHHHIEIFPVAPGQDLARRRGCDQRQKTCIDQHRRQPAGFRGKRHHEASRDPDDHQCQQGHALYRQPSGPVRNRREQETRDHRRQITVEHFMDMPVTRRKCRYQRQLAVKHRQPDQHRQTGIDRAQQKERAKAGRKQRPALIVRGGATAPAMAALPSPDLTSPRRPASAVSRTAPRKPAWPCPTCGTALASARLPGVPTTISATMPMP